MLYIVIPDIFSHLLLIMAVNSLLVRMAVWEVNQNKLKQGIRQFGKDFEKVGMNRLLQRDNWDSFVSLYYFLN